MPTSRCCKSSSWYLEHNLLTYVEDSYPYHTYYSGNGRGALWVLSKYPLLAEDFSAYAEDSTRLRFQIEIKGERLTFYNVHLVNPLVSDDGQLTNRSAAHDLGVDRLIDRLKDEAAPLIVTGDFNMTEFNDGHRRMTEDLINSFRESGNGLGLTFPADSFSPLIRIDYVFHSPDLRSLNAQVLPSNGGSDHFPLRVELSLSP